ncbi:hypothetical protein HY485_02050 [Candidatus Woesearchaeota archaeon]|nr:hypothetical protein [Candidatus Woesearchaeota archaeon]
MQIPAPEWTALRAALTYGFWHVWGLYQQLQDTKLPHKRETIKTHLELTTDQLNTLEHHVKELVGLEFITISEELRKYQC